MKENISLTDSSASENILQEILNRVVAIEKLLQADNPSESIEISNESLPAINWTASKTDLIELIYGLYANRTFNHGKITIKTITRFFETSLGMKLGNTSLRFQEILRRKESIAFIDQLRNSLGAYIERIDDMSSS